MTRLKVLMGLFFIGMVLTGVILAYFVKGYYDDRIEADNIREIAYGTVSENQVKEPEESETAAGEAADEGISIDFASLKEINSDTMGWLQACDGEIDGPVVQTTDNSFYLDHRFDGSSGSVGCFFADAELPDAFGAPLTVVYGHNRKDGSMFHPLLNYKDEQYFKQHPTFVVWTEDEEITYRVFSAFFADNDVVYGDAFMNAVKNGEEGDALKLLFEEAKEKSLYDAGEDLKLDNIVILSTCEYSGDNNRMVVFGVKVR